MWLRFTKLRDSFKMQSEEIKRKGDKFTSPTGTEHVQSGRWAPPGSLRLSAKRPLTRLGSFLLTVLRS